MTRKLQAVSALAALAFVPSYAAANSGANPSAGAGSMSGALRSKVMCHDLQNVPVTADAEQALPMNIVTRLACGAEVSLLSDSEGYSVNVGTPDGKSGYVARMYLSAPLAAPKRAAEAVVNAEGIARWQSGAPGSDQFYSNDSLVESLTLNGITVQVSLQDTGWKMRASVAIANDSDQNMSFNPAGFMLDELTPRLRTLSYQNPNELAKALTHQVYWTNASAVAPASSTYMNASYKPAGEVVTTNYLAQDSQLANVLSARTLVPKEKTAGVVWFERDKNSQQLNLRIFVSDQIFEFPFTFSQQR